MKDFLLFSWRGATHCDSLGDVGMKTLIGSVCYRRQSTATILTEWLSAALLHWSVAPDMTAPHNASFTKNLNTQQKICCYFWSPYIVVWLHHRLCIKMDNTSPLPPTVQKWSQNIPDTGTAILCWRCHLGPEYQGPAHTPTRLGR